MARNSNTKIKVEGVEDVIKALERADKEMQHELRNIVSEAVELVFREADARIPIKSGKARGSLKIETGFNNKGVFYANVVVGGSETYYITFYELGSSRQPPRPFLRPSLDGKRNEIRRYMISEIQKVIARQGK